MNNRKIKVVDEHNIDREANIIFGFDLDGSEYVTYWIERDEDSNNVFVSKVIKNLDNTFNLANIEDEFEKESVSKIVKELISKSVSDESDKLMGEEVTLENGKIVKFISVSFNKEQRLDVKKTYITTVKKEVTKVSEKYYDVVSVEEVKEVEMISESVNDIFPETVVPVTETLPEEPKILEPVVELSTPAISEPVLPVVEEKPLEEIKNDEFFTFGEEKNVETEVAGAIVEPITSQPVMETSIEEFKVEELPVLEAPVIEKHELPEVQVTPEPIIVEPKVILPEPVSQPVEAPVLPESAPISETPSIVEPVAVPVQETQPLVFNASKETNLNAALGEVATDATIPVENIEIVREFGEESPALTQSVQTPVTPSSIPAANIIQPEVQPAPAAVTPKAGFANSKFFMVVAVAFFLASCVFLGYEVFNYFQLTK